MARLTDRERDAYDLRHGPDGLTVGQIARRMKITPARVSVVLRRAERKVRKLGALEDDMPPGEMDQLGPDEIAGVA